MTFHLFSIPTGCMPNTLRINVDVIFLGCINKCIELYIFIFISLFNDVLGAEQLLYIDVLIHTAMRYHSKPRSPNKDYHTLVMSCKMTHLKSQSGWEWSEGKKGATLVAIGWTLWRMTLGMTMVDLREAMWDREAWRVLSHRVTEGWTWLNGCCHEISLDAVIALHFFAIKY